jgi:hypothetical protein
MTELITRVANTVRTSDDLLTLMNYMSTVDDLPGEDFKAILAKMSSTLAQQQQPQYARQIQLMSQIFPLDPNDQETTIVSDN